MLANYDILHTKYPRLSCCASFWIVCLFPRATLCLRGEKLRPVFLWTRGESGGFTLRPTFSSAHQNSSRRMQEHC